MTLYPNCKINIGLRVIRKREDGYHDLETIFFPVYGLYDTLEVTPADEFAFTQEGITVDCNVENNLIVRAYLLMASVYPEVAPVHIHLKKNIPFGAGLGGGSSDAAHTVLALNELFHLGLCQETMMDIVRPLGADCPFFILNTPCYAEGIGDKLTPVLLDLNGLHLILVKPEEGVSTREAYAGIIRHPEAEGEIRQAIQQYQRRDYINGSIGIAALFEVAINDFEQNVFAIHPKIANIKKHLLDAGAVYAAMSGSGSTVFAFFKDDTEGRSFARNRLLDKDLTSMILFNDTLGKAES